MDFATLSADLSTQHYLHIVKSKSDRQHNHALLLDTHTDQLSPNCVPAMIPSPYFHDDKPRLVFDCHIHEARRHACFLHDAMNLNLNGRYYDFPILVNKTPKSKDDWERLKRRDEETEIMRARIAAKLEEQGPSGAKEPMLGDEAEGEGDSKTKFLVFCTADVPRGTLHRFFEENAASSFNYTDRADLAVLQSSDLSDTLSLSSSPSVYAFEFRKNFPFEIHNIFLSLIAPIADACSFFATSTYFILDTQTVHDGSTCLLVTDAGGEMESRRAEFPVALLSAVAAEMGMLGLGNGKRGAGLDDGEILTVQTMA